MEEPQDVIITNIKIPFFSLVGLMIKWGLAAIPALLVLGVIGGGLVIGVQFGLETLGIEIGSLFSGLLPGP